MRAKAEARAAWMQRFEEGLVARQPGLRGRVDWDTASHPYNTGVCAAEAVARYLISHCETVVQ